MKTTNHTPVPWGILEQANDTRTHISNGAHIIATLGTTRTDGSPNHYANARLIAAAPELLDALQFLLADWIAIGGEKLTGSSVPADMARVAIAKATGE